MIKLEHVVLPSPEQMEFVIEGMRNPMNSWDKSDSKIGYGPIECEGNMYHEQLEPNQFLCGINDYKLMQKLSSAGTDHRKFMRMMPVMVRITAPLYWWKEFDTYKVGTVANSCSTMHKIAEKEFTIDDFSTEHLDWCTWSRLEFDELIHTLNSFRSVYLDGGEVRHESSDIVYHNPKDKDIWWQLIQLLPSSYNQTRNVMLNYEVLANIYHSRRADELDEWVEFCKWIETLPYRSLITNSQK